MSECPKVMGILNVTPDSFSDGGQFMTLDNAMQQARYIASSGADIIDIGGESTRPQAKPISAQEELDRIMPVIEKIRAELPIKISVDTSKAIVMQEAIAMQVDMINDINALQNEGCLAAVAASPTVNVCLMHMQGTPQTMQQAPYYADVVAEVKTFLQQRIATCLQTGIDASRLLIDPGFGFGKTLEHNVQLMKQLDVFTQLNYPVLVGVSRKSMIGALLNKTVDQRLYGGLALAVIAVAKGAAMIRTHDVGPTVDAIKVTHATLAAKQSKQN